MKKIFYIAIFVLLSFVMISCKEDHKYSININSVSGLRNAVVVNYAIVDPEAELKSSIIKAEIRKADSESVFSSRDVKYNTTSAEEIKFLGLESGVAYTVSFVAGVDGKEVVLTTQSVTTSLEGNTVESPYLIKTVDDFTTILKNDLDGHYKLGADIDFAGKSISPLFTNTTQFTGTFDGDGHTISNFKVGTAETLSTVNNKYFGLFGYVGAKGVIKNVKLDNFEFHVKRTSTTTFIALLAGYNAGTISDVTVTNSSMYVEIDNTSSPNAADSSGNLTGYYIAGLVGQNRNGASIKNCNVDLDINVKAKRGAVVGGICAINSDNSNVEKENVIDNCKFNGSIDVAIANTTSTTHDKVITSVGGIIGKNYYTVSNCEVLGSIKLVSQFKTPLKETDEKNDKYYRLFCGGLVGWNVSDLSVVKDSKASVNLNVDSKDALELAIGLLVGQNGGTSNSSYSLVSNCTYTLPTDGTVEVTAYEGRISKDNVGLIGVDKNPTEGNVSTSAFDIKVNIFHTEKVVDEETQKETEEVVLKETSSISVK